MGVVCQQYILEGAKDTKICMLRYTHALYTDKLWSPSSLLKHSELKHVDYFSTTGTTLRTYLVTKST